MLGDVHRSHIHYFLTDKTCSCFINNCNHERHKHNDQVTILLYACLRPPSYNYTLFLFYLMLTPGFINTIHSVRYWASGVILQCKITHFIMSYFGLWRCQQPSLLLSLKILKLKSEGVWRNIYENCHHGLSLVTGNYENCHHSLGSVTWNYENRHHGLGSVIGIYESCHHGRGSVTENWELPS